MITKLYRRIRELIITLWREVAKFGAVGGVAFIIDSAIFLWLISGPMDDSQLKAKVVAGVVATMFSWVANRYWTFRHKRSTGKTRELVMFLVMNAIGLGIQTGCVGIAKYVLGLTSVTEVFIAGNVIGLVLATIFRFFAYKYWVFTTDRSQLADLPTEQDPAADAAATTREPEASEPGVQERAGAAEAPRPAQVSEDVDPTDAPQTADAPRTGETPRITRR